MRTLLSTTALACFLSASVALAQEASDPANGDTANGDTSTESSAYDSLSPGGKMIAEALFDAQQPADDGASTNTQSTALTLDEIAAMKQDGQGWGQVFKSMQAQGLVTEKNLGMVVSKSRRGLLVPTDAPGIDTPVADDDGAASAATSARAPIAARHAGRGSPKRPVIVTFGDGGSMVAGPVSNRGRGDVRGHGIAGKPTAGHGNGKSNAGNSNAGKSNAPVTFGGTAPSNGGAGSRGHAAGGNGHGNGAMSSPIVTTGTSASSAAAAGFGAATHGGNGKGHAYGRHKSK